RSREIAPPVDGITRPQARALAGEAGEVFLAPQRPVEPRRADLEGVRNMNQIGHVERRRDVSGGLGAVIDADVSTFRPVDIDPKHPGMLTLEIDRNQLVMERGESLLHNSFELFHVDLHLEFGSFLAFELGQKKSGLAGPLLVVATKNVGNLIN